jgi:carbonic anhydrase
MTFLRTARVCLLVVVMFVLTAALVQSADPHLYHEGNYGTAGLPHTDLSGSKATWDYTSLNKWPALCRTGSRQSPISFTNVDASEVVKDAPLKRLQLSSKCFFPKDETQMRIINEGAVNMVSFERQGRLPEDLSECTVVDPLNKSRIFYFSELHFHATSEHKFRNLRPDVEMHLSFVTDEVKEKKREVLIVAVMLKASASINSTSVRALRHILVDGSLPRRHATTTCFLTEDMSITSLLPARESYLLYDGSETHPPCRENVRWVVMTSPVLISRVAVGKLRDAMDQLLPNDFHRVGNARPPQALNGRRIYRFDDTSVPQGGRRSEGNLDDAWTKKKQGDAGMLNESAVDDIFRLQEGDAQPEDSAFADLSVYGGDAKRVLTTTTTHHPAASSAAVESNTTTRAITPAAAAASAASSFSHAVASASVDRDVRKQHNASSSSASTPDVTTAHTSANASEAVNATAGTPAAAASSSNSTAASSASADVPPPHAHTTAGSTTTTTTTTKPPAHKGKKGHGSVSKNTSEAASNSDSAAGVAKSIETPTSGAWERFKTFGSQVVATTTTYIQRYPGKVALIVLCNVVVFFLICICIRGWKSPAYVVGIDPRELEPLYQNPVFGQYGGTTSGGAAVRPAKPPTSQGSRA